MSEQGLYQAYFLHVRGFKESSAIAECFSKEMGLVACLAKGAKRPKSKWRGLVQPFVFVNINWRGRGEVKTIIQLEAEMILPRLQGKSLLMGFYLNELLLKLVHRADPYPELFDDYHQVLTDLSRAENDKISQVVLRRFECKLLKSLGFGLDLQKDVNDEAIVSDLIYGFDQGYGFYPQAVLPQSKKILAISGETLIALRGDTEFTSDLQLLEAKKLMRFALAHQLGGKELKTRQLFAQTIVAEHS
jgi:DNA repair protein RecO (recombination protein O)